MKALAVVVSVLAVASACASAPDVEVGVAAAVEQPAWLGTPPDGCEFIDADARVKEVRGLAGEYLSADEVAQLEQESRDGILAKAPELLVGHPELDGATAEDLRLLIESLLSPPVSCAPEEERATADLIADFDATARDCYESIDASREAARMTGDGVAELAAGADASSTVYVSFWEPQTRDSLAAVLDATSAGEAVDISAIVDPYVGESVFHLQFPFARDGVEDLSTAIDIIESDTRALLERRLERSPTPLSDTDRAALTTSLENIQTSGVAIDGIAFAAPAAEEVADTLDALGVYRAEIDTKFVRVPDTLSRRSWVTACVEDPVAATEALAVVQTAARTEFGGEDQ